MPYFIVTGLIVIGGIAGLAFYKQSVPSPYEPFAQCLTDKGVKMWGAWWCSHCQAQKKLFGTAFDKVTYNECSTPGKQDMTPLCKNAGITNFPTWEFADGSRVQGEQSLEELAKKSGCSLPVIIPTTP